MPPPRHLRSGSARVAPDRSSAGGDSDAFAAAAANREPFGLRDVEVTLDTDAFRLPPRAPLPLPIEPVLGSLAAALQTHNTAVLQAPPGAGKTTRVPLALLHESWLSGQKLVMLEPRRLAARAAARYMAALIHEDVGQTVGYRVRLDSRVGAKTRVEVVTEGVLTRMLQEDPT